MCGINGILDLESKKVDKNRIKLMCDAMKHRGPDAEGIYTNNNIGLGHRRLSIIDLSPTGKQPMQSRDKRYVIVFNGEIYNYKELLSELKTKGYVFSGHSDTEVILNLYIDKGVECLKYLRGMFAFAIWDNMKKELFIARDRFGEKPLLYGTFDNKFYFASEIRSILEGSDCKREINLEALHMYLLYNLNHVPEPYSIINGIHKLPPAHYMLITGKKIKIKKYWNLDYTKYHKTEKELMEEYTRLANECVNLREVSDVPISALLSGGVDSSTVVAFMDKKNPISTFSMGFNVADPELIRARKVSKQFKTKNTEIIFKKEYVKKIPQIIYYYGEPYNLMPALYSHILAENIHKKGFKVTLAGNGADELFYGYDGSNGLLLLTRLEHVLPKFIFKVMDKLTPKKLTSLKMSLKILGSDKNKQKGNLYRYYGNIIKNDLYTQAVAKKLSKFDDGKLIDDVTAECNSKYLIERFYYAGLMLENAHSTTIVADTTGMANSIEIRAPFLDHKLAEFAARLPLNMKVRSLSDKKYNKYIMKKSMEGILTDEILYGKKMGFGYNIRFSELIRTEWKFKMGKIFKELKKLELFKPEYLDTLLMDHQNRKKDNSKLIGALFHFYIWHELYIKRKNLSDVNI